MNVGETGRGLECGIQFEFPAIVDGIAKKGLQVIGRGAVGLDLKPLPVRRSAAIVIGGNMYMKDKNISREIIVKHLGDVRAEGRVNTIWSLLGTRPQFVVNESVCRCLAVGGKNHRPLRQRSRGAQEQA